jgi:AraC-like DNA-binding protein
VDVARLEHTSDDARWLLCTWRPEALAGSVESLWYFEGRMPPQPERHAPNGLLDLVVSLGDRYRMTDRRGSQVLGHLAVSGLQTTPFLIEGPERHRVVGLNLHPAAAYSVFGPASAHLTDVTTDLSDLVGAAAQELADRCHASATPDECLRRAACWVRDRLRGGPALDPAVRWATAQIDRCHGAISIAAIRGRLGLSASRFSSSFQSQIGVKPKLYARLVRFRHVSDLLRQGAPAAEAALLAGYFDQPHMTHEFRDLSGLTPAEYLARRNPGATSTAEV